MDIHLFDTFPAQTTGMPQFKIFHLEGIKNFGVASKVLRSKEQEMLNDDFMNAMPNFNIFGSVKDKPKKVCLWDYSRKINNNKDFKTLRQITGSCVSQGFGNVLWYLQAIEILKNGDQEECKQPFFLLPYGRSRLIGGLRGRGEGSFGSAIAEAAKRDGCFAFDETGIPKPTIINSGSYDDGLTYGEKLEMDWSDGAKIDEKWLKISRNHLIKTTSVCRNADDVREAIINGYPVTIASNWGGSMKPNPQGSKEPILLNSRTDTWQHQMCILGWWEHPEFGEVFYIMNSWGTYTHGKCPSGAPMGGFWVRKKDVDYIAKQNEAIAYSQYNGFPAQRMSDYLFNTFPDK